MRTRADHIAMIEAEIATYQNLIATNSDTWPGDECLRQRHAWAKILHQSLSKEQSKLSRLRDKEKRQAMRGKRA